MKIILYFESFEDTTIIESKLTNAGLTYTLFNTGQEQIDRYITKAGIDGGKSLETDDIKSILIEILKAARSSTG